ncbi:MAG TPA: response regulator transcription factor [Solirubrobacteraceae bacterium]|nr:response regulator transcription factor [Solirubrobacteraceae bacterium]
MIRLLVADDHPLVRSALAQLFDATEDIAVVAVASNGEEAVAAALDTSPDVILMDLEMPRLDGIEAIRHLKQAGSSASVVILTTFSDRARILGAIDAGALGYLLKDAEQDEIIRGVRAAAGGDAPLAPRAAREMLANRQPSQPATGLSPRELEVLRLVAKGLPNKLIARELEISEKTVKAHLTSVFSQIGVTDRTQAALWAQRHDLGD